jgi:hypothetical protein
MDSAVRLLSEWSMRSWSDEKSRKVKKFECPKSPILLVISLTAAVRGRSVKATPLGASAQGARLAGLATTSIVQF